MQNRIKDLREEKNWTQIRLSTALGVTQETISAYENGKHKPSVSTLSKLAEIFNASMDYIMGLSDERHAIRIDSLSELEIRCLSIFETLDDTQKAMAIAYMQGLKK